MTFESLLQSVHVLVEVIGFGVIIFKGGAYIGKTNQILENQGNAITDLKDRHIKHSQDDHEQFTKISETLTQIRVSVASNGKN